MPVIILWAVFMGICAWAGHKVFTNKGQNGMVGAGIAAVVSLFFSPLIGGIAVAVMYFVVPNNNAALGQGGGFIQPAHFNQPQQGGYRPMSQQGGYQPMAPQNQGGYQPMSQQNQGYQPMQQQPRPQQTGGYVPMTPPVQVAQPYQAPQQQQAASPSDTGVSSDRAQRLKELELLKSEGLISEAEYTQMRADILKV